MRIAARGASAAAFAARCIRAGGVAPPSHTFGILGCRALPSRRLARLGATRHLHHGLLAAALVAALVTCAVQAADGFPAILERTSAYVAKFEQEFASIIWHETYEQIDRLPRTFGASGGRLAGVTRRHLESEMLFIMAESDGAWLTVRDVISVDGKPVPRRLPTLLASPNVWIRESARAVAGERPLQHRGDLSQLQRADAGSLVPRLPLPAQIPFHGRRTRWRSTGAS